jgi:hypothetical protein
MQLSLGALLLLGGLVACDATPTDPTPGGSVTSPSSVSLAKGPLHEVFYNDPGGALPDIDCGSFTIRETSFTDRLAVTTYFNAAGDPVKVRLHLQFSGVLTNLSSGKTLRDHAAWTGTFNFAEGTVTTTGVVFHYKVPRVGMLRENGRIVVDLETGEVLSASGPHDFTGQGLSVICPLLA